MAAITAIYLFVAGPGGLLLVLYVCVAFVILAPPPVSAPIVLLLCAAVVVLPQYVRAWDLDGLQWAFAVPAAITALGMYALRMGMASQMALYQARAEVERLAAEQERLRIARDLHDLLGHALTSVVVKADLASRLATIDPARAAAEMEEVAGLARQGLADVRAAVAGYREVSLGTELATAREVLRAAGIDADLPTAIEAVSRRVGELFGWVVREGVTNVVRHSRASLVRVRVDERSIEVVDDGEGGSAATGNGLAGLTERVTAAGGRVLAGPMEGGGWRLLVEVPA